jgi:hypothetical protein
MTPLTTTARHAAWLERHALPLAAAWIVGYLCGQWRTEVDLMPNMLAAQELAAQARHRARVAEARQELWAQACEPLLTLPIEATPEIIAADLRGDERSR